MQAQNWKSNRALKCGNCLQPVNVCECRPGPAVPLLKERSGLASTAASVVFALTFFFAGVYMGSHRIDRSACPTFDDGVVYGQRAIELVMAQGRPGVQEREALRLAYALWIKDQSINNGGK